MNAATKKLIKRFEGLHDGDLKTIGLQPKMCPAGIWTEGYGRAMIDPNTKGHLRGKNNARRALALQTIRTEKDADIALEQDYNRLGVLPAKAALGIDYWDKLNENQRGALGSFVYNCGTGSPRRYKIFENLRAYLNGTMSAAALDKYWKGSVIRVGDKIMKGLVLRREAEVQLFFSA